MKPESRWGELNSKQKGNMILFKCVLNYHTHWFCSGRRIQRAVPKSFDVTQDQLPEGG